MSQSERIIEKEELRSYSYDTKEPIKSSDFSSSLNQGYIGEEDRLKNLSLSGGSVTNPNVIVLHPVGEPSLQTQSNFSSSQYISEPIPQQPLAQTFEQPRLIQSEEYIRKPVDTTVLPVEGELAGTKLSKKQKKKLLLTPEQRQAKNTKLAGLTGAKRDKAIAKRRAKIEKRELKIRTLQDQISALNVSSWSSRSDVSGIGAVAPAGTGVGYSYSSGVSDYSSGLSSTGVAGSSNLGYAGEAHQAERPGLMTRLKTKMRRNKTPADRDAKLARLRNLSGQEREDMLVKKRHKLNLAEEKVRYLREQLALLEGSNLPMSSGMSSGWVSGSSSSLMTGSIGSVAACPHVQSGYNACATCLPTSTMAPVGLGATSVGAPIGLGASSAGLSSGLASNVEGNMATRDLIASETTATSETNAAGKYGGAHGIGEMLSREKDFNTASRTDAGVIPASHNVAGLAATEPVMSATGVPGAMETVAEGRHGGAHSIREMLSKEKDFPAISRQAEVSGVAPSTATSVNAAEHKPGLIERITEKITGKHHRDTVHP